MTVYLTRAGVRLPRLLFALLVAFVAVVLAVTMLPADPVVAVEEPESSETTEEPEAGDSDGDGDLDRPDTVSAGVTARALDKPIESLEKRSEFSRTFVNPDGTYTEERFSGAVRVQGDNGAWKDVDYTLTRQEDGSYAPRVSDVDVTVDGGGAKEAARLTFDDGNSLAVTWPENLPEPTVEGGVATYKVSDTSDLLVSVTGDGVNARIRLNSAPVEDDPVFTLGLRADGVDVVESDGGLQVKDSDGKTIGRTSKLVAWDATTDDSGDPDNIVPLESNLEEVASNGDVTRHELELTAPEGFLTDPATEFPVIVDPDLTTTSNLRNTWVRNGSTANNYQDYRLISGKINGSSNTNPARSFLQFDNAAFAGRDIVKAELGLWQYYGYSCTDRRMWVLRVTQEWTASILWANQPAATTENIAGVLTNRGASGCGQGWTMVDITAMSRLWAANAATNKGMRLNAGDESLSAFQRNFCSRSPDSSVSACSTAARRPYIKVTYNRPPNTPGAFALAPSVADGATRLTNSRRPKVYVNVSDPDGGQVRAHMEIKNSAGTVVFNEATYYATSGGRAERELPVSLADGTYTVRFRAYDGRLYSGWTGLSTFKVDATPPAVPTVTCTNVTTGTWYETRPASSTTCSVSASGGAVEFDWTRGNKRQTPIRANASGAASLGTFSIPDDGVFAIAVKAKDLAGNYSAARAFGFGVGEGGTITPVEGERTSSTVLTEAEAPEGATSARVEHRPAGTEGDAGWVTATQVKPLGSIFPWLGGITATGNGSDSTGKLVWDIAAETGVTKPSVRETRVCFVYSGVSRCTPSREVTIVPAAFGSSFPTQDAGPGQVALFTGEFQVSESDIEVPAYSGTLSLGRSHRSYAGATAPAQGVFGPGWVADLEGPGTGAAGYEVVDNTATTGSITLVSPDGVSSTYRHEDGYATAQRNGYYEGDLETETENDYLEVTGSGGSKKLILLQDDGTITTWAHVGSGAWVVEKIDEPGDTGTTTYTHDAAGLVTGIYAPAPSGVTCDAATQQAGCRALLLNYTGTGADRRLSQVDLRIWDPKPGADGRPTSAAGMVTVPVQKYAYNTDGTLKETWDPRIADGTAALKTAYEYATIGTKTVLTKATPPGEVPWRFEYATSGTDAGKLQFVKRAQPAGVTGGDAIWTVEYGTALSGTGLPDLTPAATATWGQEAAPTGAATVYGPDAPGTSDTTYGTISYFDVEGRTTNTATYGAGDWQIDSSVYDAKGNVVWALDEGNRNTALTSGGVTDAEANNLATITVYNEEAPGLPAGTRVEQIYGPTRPVDLNNGDAIDGRAYTEITYDDEATTDSVPVPGRLTPDSDAPRANLAVEERASTIDAAGVKHDVSKTRYRYDPIVAGDGDGWELSTPTRTTVAVGTAVESTTLTRFDTEGKALETRTPQGVAAVDGTANDARSTKTVYYTVDASASDPLCRSKPEWAGMECLTSTGDTTVPATRSTGFDYLLNETRSEESATGGTSGAMTRTSITAFDAAGRKTTDKVTVTGAPTGDVAVPDVTYAYSPTTGALTSTTAGGVTQATTYDTWGRVLTQTDGTGNTAATTYDAAGRVKTLNDGKGTYTYTYDGTDAAGQTERRGLVTKLDVGLASGPNEFTTAANADGNTYLTTYPNGIEATTGFDATGAETSLTYTTSAGDEIAAFTNTLDSESRVRVAESSGSTQTYTYDDRDRLTKVEDTVAGQCTTREYEFSLDSNRTALKTAGPASGGLCTTSGGSTVTSSFDAADRITTTGYDYDALGRTRTVPKTHTDQPTGSDLTVAYHGNDMVAKLTQTVGGVATSKSFELDPSMRLSKTTDTTGSDELRKTTNHYSGGSDSPAWIATQTRPNVATAWAESWTRNVRGPDGDLAIIQPNTGAAKIQLVNLHGDIVATLPNANYAGLDSFVETTEYGLARPGAASLGQNYGWLGSKQRSADSIGGLTLMGVRLYNSVTGRFLSRDPVAGGNDNSYTYPVDPVNKVDLDGRESKKAKAARHALTALECSRFGASKCAKAGVVTRKLMKMIPGNTSRDNWIRHFVWQTRLLQIGGMAMAVRIGNAHEAGLHKDSSKSVRRDSRRDRINNDATQRYWGSMGALLAPHSLTSLRRLAATLWKQGWGVRVSRMPDIY